MSSFGLCRLCGEKICFTIGNPVELYQHMMDCHENGSVVQYIVEQDCSSSEESRKRSSCPRAGRCSSCVSLKVSIQDARCESRKAYGNRRAEAGYSSCCGNRVIIQDVKPGRCCAAPGGKSRNRSPCQKPRRKRLYTRGFYKTTLETWTAGGGYILCPNCGKEVKPLIRSQKNKVAYTSLGAAFLLSCWPFCFLFPLLHKCSVDLYCSHCKYPLGVYNSATGKIRPYCQVPNMDTN